MPGLLFIDTPGHHSFSTLRSRGGALADIAVLVVDITEGFKPQTIEPFQMYRSVAASYGTTTQAAVSGRNRYGTRRYSRDRFGLRKYSRHSDRNYKYHYPRSRKSRGRYSESSDNNRRYRRRFKINI